MTAGNPYNATDAQSEFRLELGTVHTLTLCVIFWNAPCRVEMEVNGPQVGQGISGNELELSVNLSSWEKCSYAYSRMNINKRITTQVENV